MVSEEDVDPVNPVGFTPASLKRDIAFVKQNIVYDDRFRSRR